MRTVLELTLLFTLALVSVSYANVRDELLELKLQCHKYGYAKVNVTENGAIASIELKKPAKSSQNSSRERDYAQIVNVEKISFPNFEP